MAELKDSGIRQEFESGAVRDISEGKGRCDLLPLGVISEIICDNGKYDLVLHYIQKFIDTGIHRYIYEAVLCFCFKRQWDIYTAMIETSIHYEDGAKKYNERNWEKGILLHCFIDSGIRHYLKWLRGDQDEPHDRAFLWNMFGAVWTYENKPELNDITKTPMAVPL